MTWERIDDNSRDGAHYSVMRLARGISGMAALREMFPNGAADPLNFVLFSTSGVHGTYNLIEDAETGLALNNAESGKITFLVIHPRLVAVRYGLCQPVDQTDITFLKRLRESSRAVMAGIG